MPNFGPFKTVGKNLMNYRTACLIFILILANGCSMIAGFSQGYEIKIKIQGLQDTTVILGHYLNKSMYPDDTTKIDKKGYGVFTGNIPLPGGMYLIYLPNTRYFEMIMGDDQEFALETDTFDFIKSLSYKGSEENKVFLDFQRYMIALRKEADSIQTRLKNAKDGVEKDNLIAQSNKINETRISYIEKIASDYPHLFVAKFIKATLDIRVPDPPKDENG